MATWLCARFATSANPMVSAVRPALAFTAITPASRLCCDGRRAARGVARSNIPSQTLSAARRMHLGMSMGGHEDENNLLSKSAGTCISAARARVYAISDLHADYKPNMDWIKKLPSRKIRPEASRQAGDSGDVSVLLLAGDVASDLTTLEEGFMCLKTKYDHVVFVPGNHELWCQRGDGDKARDSMVKLQDVMAVCARCHVHTKPLIIQHAGAQDGGLGGRLMLLPFLSWYHADFDKDPALPAGALEILDIPGMRAFEERWSDFKYCSWPESTLPADVEWKSLNTSSRHIAQTFADMNADTWLPEIAAIRDNVDIDTKVIRQVEPRTKIHTQKRTYEPASTHVHMQTELTHARTHTHTHTQAPAGAGAGRRAAEATNHGHGCCRASRKRKSWKRKT